MSASPSRSTSTPSSADSMEHVSANVDSMSIADDSLQRAAPSSSPARSTRSDDSVSLGHRKRAAKQNKKRNIADEDEDEDGNGSQSSESKRAKDNHGNSRRSTSREYSDDEEKKEADEIREVVALEELPENHEEEVEAEDGDAELGETGLAAAAAERLALNIQSDNRGIESLEKTVAEDNAFMRRTKKQVRHDKRQQALDCILDNEARPIIESDEQVEREAEEAARLARKEKSGKPSDQSVEAGFEQLRDRHVQRLANKFSDEMLEDAAREEGDGIPVASLGLNPSPCDQEGSEDEDEEEELEEEQYEGDLPEGAAMQDGDGDQPPSDDDGGPDGPDGPASDGDHGMDDNDDPNDARAHQIRLAEDRMNQDPNLGLVFDPDNTLFEYIELLYKYPVDNTPMSVCNAALSCLERKWTALPGQTMNDFVHLRYGLDINHAGGKDLNDLLNKQYAMFQSEALATKRLFHRLGRYQDDTHPNWLAVEQHFNRIYQRIRDSYQHLWFEHGLYHSMNNKLTGSHPVFNVYAFQTVTSKKFTGMAKLLHRLLHMLEQQGMKKENGRVHQQKLNDKGEATGFWEECGTIKQWMHRNITADSDPDIWSLMSTHGAAAAQSLDLCFDRQFQFLQRDRRVFSFQDGRYFADCNGYFDQFISYDKCAGLDHIASANYFDVPFNSKQAVGHDYVKVGDTYTFDNNLTLTDAQIAADPSLEPLPSWFDELDTEPVTAILTAQGFSRKVQKEFWAQAGSLLYATGSLHHWEKYMFLLGLPRTGKSTLGKMLFETYTRSDVGILSNTVEETFGVYAVWGKLICGCLEVKSSFGLPEAEMQSMVSGEYISMAVKNEKARHVKWDVPILLVGNQWPAWDNTGGAMSRRAIPFVFGTPIKDDDVEGDMDKKIDLHRGAILRKMLWGVHTRLLQVGNGALDKTMDETLIQNSKDLGASQNSLEAFLVSGLVATAKGSTTTYIPREVFRVHYYAFCNRESMKIKSLTKSNTEHVFFPSHIKEVKRENEMYHGRVMPGRHIFYTGIDLVERINRSSEAVPGSEPFEVDDPYSTGRGKRNGGLPSSYKNAAAASATENNNSGNGNNNNNRNKRPRENQAVSAAPASPPNISRQSLREKPQHADEQEDESMGGGSWFDDQDEQLLREALDRVDPHSQAQKKGPSN